MPKRIRRPENSEVRIAIKSIQHRQIEGMRSLHLQVRNDPDFPLAVYSTSVVKFGVPLELWDQPIGLS
jgi:hypothetical protein